MPLAHAPDGSRIPLALRIFRTADVNELHFNRAVLKKFSSQYAALVEQVLVAQGLPG